MAGVAISPYSPICSIGMFSSIGMVFGIRIRHGDSIAGSVMTNISETTFRSTGAVVGLDREEAGKLKKSKKMHTTPIGLS